MRGHSLQYATLLLAVFAPLSVDALVDLAQVGQIDAGETHTCAVTLEGTVVCWGHNQSGQLGDGTTADRAVAVKVSGLAASVARISAGGSFLINGSYMDGIPTTTLRSHTCAVTSSGGVKCWGANDLGQLGDGSTTQRLTPVDVSGLGSGIVDVAAGGAHTCALTATGHVMCWGANEAGQLGNGTTQASTTPVDVAGLSGVAEIAAAYRHTCARTTAGAIFCWGANESGQLGDGTTTNRGLRVAVTSLSANVSRIAVGGGKLDGQVEGTGGRSCAVTGTGGVMCWGYAFSGSGNALTPVEVAGLQSGVEDVATAATNYSTLTAPNQFSRVFFSHSCALLSDGSPRCWGSNYFGQLGNGASLTTSAGGGASATPVPVVGLANDVAEITTGGRHTCALMVTGLVRCWGFGEALGTGTMNSSSTPAAVKRTESGLIPQAIQLVAPQSIAIGASIDLTVTGGDSGNPVTLESATPGTCSISGTVLTGLANGLCAIVANQAGNAQFDPAAETRRELRVGDPLAQSITFGAAPIVLVGGTGTVSATATSGLAVSFSSNTPSVCTVSGGTVTGNALGICVVAASQPGNFLYAAAPQATQSFRVGDARLANVSTRGQVLTGEDVMIAGFIIGGTTPKTVVVNVAGPSLAEFGVSASLANPSLTLVRSSDNAVIAFNDNWADAANSSQFRSTGFAPRDALEPAILATLDPGAYTAIVQGVGGGTGVGLVGVFEVDRPDIPLVNLSTRGHVLTGEGVLIAGFIIQGQGPQTVVVNVAGPSLANFGITHPLANPRLTLVRSSDGATVATNDDWQTAANMSQVQASGFAPNHPLEPALMMTLPPGAYTAIVQGAGNASGTALIGVFAVAQP